MQTRTLLFILIVVLTVLVIAGSCATRQSMNKAPVEALYGTWMNTDYNGSGVDLAKTIHRADGTHTEFGHTDITEGADGVYSILDSWMDSAGNKYYKVKKHTPGFPAGKYAELWKIDETESVAETIWNSGTEFPTEIDPEHPRYRILYRQ